MTHHPSPIQSYRGGFYTLVIVDDYLRYTWTFFLKTKSEAFDKFKALGKGLQNLLGHSIVSIQTDHGRELDNEIQFGVFCDKHGISHNFSEPHTPQSSGVVERKNQTFQEMSRTMLNEQFIPQRFWCHAVKTVAYILNRVLIGKTINKTPYEILRCRKPSLEYFRVFGCKCIIFKSLENPNSNDSISYNGIFLGSHAQDRSNFFAFVSTIEPKNIKEAIKDESWTMAMQEELDQFIRNDVWGLVPCLVGHTIIGTKWVFRNKLDENGIVCRNKDRLVAQAYNQQEGIDCNETHAPVARLESIRILLKYACFYMFKLFQIDVKGAFLNGVIDKEVYVAQPPGFVDFQKPNHVYKLKKALYGLKQAPKAWTMSNTKGSVNKGETGESSKKSKRKFETMKGYEGDERIMFEFILRGFTESDIWDKVKVPLSPRMNENEYSICCENTTHMMNDLKEARMKSREMLLSIHHSLKMLLEIISKMNRKLEDEKVKKKDKGKEKVNDF
ncbi:retrovirus-related pol polyprotein from transposon TNT 1-94 [Tanacetum coccineum]